MRAINRAPASIHPADQPAPIRQAMARKRAAEHADARKRENAQGDNDDQGNNGDAA